MSVRHNDLDIDPEVAHGLTPGQHKAGRGVAHTLRHQVICRTKHCGNKLKYGGIRMRRSLIVRAFVFPNIKSLKITFRNFRILLETINFEFTVNALAQWTTS